MRNRGLPALSLLLSLSFTDLSTDHAFGVHWGRRGLPESHGRSLRLATSGPEAWWSSLQDSFTWLLGRAPALEKLPCNSGVGLELLQTLKDEGEDAFVDAMQSELLKLRDAGSEDRESRSYALQGGEDDAAVLQRRIADIDQKEQTQQILADLLYLGTVHRLRSDGLALVNGPLDEEPGTWDEVALLDALRVLPAAVAVEAKDYVLSAVPATLEGSVELQVTRANLAPLLMGAGLYGYFLAGVAQSRSAGEIAQLAASDWDSPAAFAVVSARVGHLLALPPESSDPLRQYASLSAVSTEVQTVQRGQTAQLLKDLGQMEGGLMGSNVYWLRGLLGEFCAFGYFMRLFEQKIVKFVCPD
ncbi:unnamed protein product [Polarella glacialis]|uniref:Uncharacterized protein n=1 Tax=Polarella glacialis TaxID=89957 RepID=A0A813DSL4_POLGL|nr:unnamed protein product [Polarella glacialis]CAE8590240.1 unnamed protein product [Polarella glacialis]